MSAGYLTIKQFCELNAITRSMFYRLIDANNAPRITGIGRRRLISRVAAEEWRQRIDGNRIKTRPAAAVEPELEPEPRGWLSWLAGGRQS
jgi:excisionase family DNA binding protein